MVNHTIILSHNFLGTTLENMVGLGCTLTIVDTPSVTVQPKYASISKTLTRSYQRFTFPVSDDDIDTILTILDTATLLIELYSIGLSGAKYTFNSDSKPLSEFKIDIGPSSKTITVTSDSTVADYSGSDFTIDTYSKKKKTNEDGGTFEYEVNPLEYKYIGLGKILTENDNNMDVISKRLVLTESSANLTVEAIQR